MKDRNAEESMSPGMNVTKDEKIGYAFTSVGRTRMIRTWWGYKMSHLWVAMQRNIFCTRLTIALKLESDGPKNHNRILG